MSTLEEVACPACGSQSASVAAMSAAQLTTDRTRFSFVRCTDCDLERLSPRVPGAEIARYYDATYLPHRGASAWGRFAHFVARSEAAQDQARVRRLLSATALGPSSRVLDVGCGRPTFLEALQAKTGARCVGLDFSDNGWRDDPARWKKLELRHGELASVQLEPGFDAITMWHSLEHDYDPIATLRQLLALAKPGAAIVIEVPNARSLTRWWHGGNWAGYHTPRHTAAYTPTTLRNMLGRAGWKVEQVAPWGTLDPYVLWWLGRQDRQQRDLSGDLSPMFFSFLAGRILATPLLMLQRWISLGVQTAIARAP